MTTRTAAIVLIGNELLSGKIRDENAHWMTGRLRSLGVDVRRIAIIPDEIPVIADEIIRARALGDHVFTSGGVGPTHDDVTMAGVAQALGVPLQTNGVLAALIKSFFAERTRPEHLNMARVPAGTVLLGEGSIPWPVCAVENIYVLPGVPSLFRAKFDAIAERFRSGSFHLRSVFLDADEGTIAAHLADLEAAHGVSIGSYPKLRGGEYRVRVTVEARLPGPVNAAVTALLGALPAEAIVRVDQRLDEK